MYLRSTAAINHHSHFQNGYHSKIFSPSLQVPIRKYSVLAPETHLQRENSNAHFHSLKKIIMHSNHPLHLSNYTTVQENEYQNTSWPSKLHIFCTQLAALVWSEQNLVSKMAPKPKCLVSKGPWSEHAQIMTSPWLVTCISPITLT